jgi:L-lactate dehydrogenase complex protein LldG
MSTPITPSTARDEILRAVRAALPPAVAAPAPRPRPDVKLPSSAELVARFTTAAIAAGAAVVVATGDPAAHANHAASDAREILSLLPGVTSTIPTPLDPHALATLDLLVCTATIGVAESGAVWLATSDMIHRAALFIAQRVVIVVKASTIVADLHDAYERIDVRAHGFGTFISGPSKTADIEQALVIGAHGPKELTLIISAA